MKSANYEGKTIAYDANGKGPAIVLLHGFGEDRTVWEEFQTDLLEENLRVVRIDLPGFGQSEVLPEVSIETMAEAVNAVVDQLQLDRFILIGHSMGGYVALAYGEKYGEKLAGLGLFHSHPYADSDKKKQDRRRSVNFINRQGHVIYLKQLFPNLFADHFARSNAFLVDKLIYRAAHFPSEGITGALNAMMNRPDRSEVLSAIACPVLFIIGKEDSVIAPEKSIEPTHLPAQASIHILEKVGHMGMFEAPKKTQRIVRQFAYFCFRVQNNT